MHLRRVSIITALMLLSAAAAWSQSYMDEPGLPAFTTSFPVEHGFINLANGALHLEIPIASYPQRGGKLQYHARLVYDSRFWTFDSNYMDHNNLHKDIPHHIGQPDGRNDKD